jgi:hypothetical protein
VEQRFEGEVVLGAGAVSVGDLWTCSPVHLLATACSVGEHHHLVSQGYAMSTPDSEIFFVDDFEVILWKRQFRNMGSISWLQCSGRISYFWIFVYSWNLILSFWIYYYYYFGKWELIFTILLSTVTGFLFSDIWDLAFSGVSWVFSAYPTSGGCGKEVWLGGSSQWIGG